MKKWFSQKHQRRPKSAHETVQQERDAFEQAVARLQEQVADLTGKYTALVFDEALTRGLAKRAIALLQKVDTKRTGGVTLQKEIDTLVGEARNAGLIAE